MRLVYPNYSVHWANYYPSFWLMFITTIKDDAYVCAPVLVCALRSSTNLCTVSCGSKAFCSALFGLVASPSHPTGDRFPKSARWYGKWRMLSHGATNWMFTIFCLSRSLSLLISLHTRIYWALICNYWASASLSYHSYICSLSHLFSIDAYSFAISRLTRGKRDFSKLRCVKLWV